MKIFNRFIIPITQVQNWFAYLLRVFKIVRDATSFITLAWLCILLIQGVLPAISLYLIRWTVDSFVAALAVAPTWSELQPAIVGAGLIASAMVLAEMLISLSDWLSVAQSERIADHVRNLIHEKASTIDLAFYDLPEYYNRLDRVQDQAGTRPLSLLQNVGSLLRDGISILSIGFVLVHYGAWLPVVLFAGTLPAFFTVLYFNRRNHRWWEQTTPKRRWAAYYDRMLTNRNSAFEVRLFDLGTGFQKAYRDTRTELRNELLQLLQIQSIFRLGAQLLTIILFALTLAFMAWRALQGVGTLGDVVLFLQAFNQGQGMFQSFLRTLGNIYKDALFLSNLFEFLDISPTIVSPEHPDTAPVELHHGIEFKGVSFRYPNSQDFVLQDFNMYIPAGQVVAIVGANGAGKSTLVKLLCRFYDPEAGVISFDGIEACRMSIEDVRHLFTVIFQQPVHYVATVAQNVAVGHGNQNSMIGKIEKASINAGAHEFISRLPKQYEALLGKLFDHGHELSDGEWQRLALARAFFRQAPIMILDEPTSALDSWSEADWFERFHNLTNGRTSIIITHRFTIAKRADLIHVMDRGSIIESGTHEQLVKLNGLYAQSWNAQMQEKDDFATNTAPLNGRYTDWAFANQESKQNELEREGV